METITIQNALANYYGDLRYNGQDRETLNCRTSGTPYFETVAEMETYISAINSLLTPPKPKGTEQMKLKLETWEHHNVLQVAVDHLVDHLFEVLTDTARGSDINEVQDTAKRLIHAATMQERLATLYWGEDNGNGRTSRTY